MRRLFTLLILLVPTLSTAQEPRFELTPTLGYRWGGDIQIDERAFRYQVFDVALDGSGSYGLRLNIMVSRKLQFELLASKQDTQLDDSQGLFGEVPSGFVGPGKLDVLNVNLTHLHAGLRWFLGHGDFQPYLVGSAGVTHIEPNVRLGDDQGLSASLGTGLKMNVTDRFGLLFEGRLFWVDTDEAESSVHPINHIDCTGDCTYTYRYQDDFVQTAVTVGLVFNF